MADCTGCTATGKTFEIWAHLRFDSLQQRRIAILRCPPKHEKQQPIAAAVATAVAVDEAAVAHWSTAAVESAWQPFAMWLVSTSQVVAAAVVDAAVAAVDEVEQR